MILFSHIPRCWDGEYTINIHGHFHNLDYRRKEKGMLALKNKDQYLISMEYTNYQLVNLDTLLGGIKNDNNTQI